MIFDRKLAVTMIRKPRKDAENGDDTEQPVGVQNLILTAEGAITRTAVAVGTVAITVIAVRTFAHITETIVDAAFKK